MSDVPRDEQKSEGVPPASIVVLAGPQLGRKFPIDRSAVLGRSATASIQIDDVEVSRHHAEVRRTAGGFVLDDLDSRNGTTVNEVPIQQAHPLAFGDKIQLGSEVVLLFTHHDQVVDQLHQRQRLETLGRLSAGVVHDFNNMLAAVLGSLDYLQKVPQDRPLGDDDIHDCLLDIRAATERAAELTPRLLAFAQEAGRGHSQVDFSAVCHTILRIVDRTFSKSIIIKHDVRPGLFVMGDSADMHQLLMNLCLNARDAMPDGGTIEITAQQLDAQRLVALRLPDDGPHVVLTIRDSGAGMDPEAIGRIFEPFYAASQGGDGIGLAAVKQIVTVHGGRVGVKSSPDQGTTFGVYLPATARPSLRPPRRRLPPAAGQGQPPAAGAILVVDDEQVVRRSLARLLRQAGYTVLEASGGERAVALYDEYAGKLDLVILDLELSDMSGEDTFRQLLRLDTTVRVFVISGCSDDARLETMHELGAVGFLQKPWSGERMLDAVRAAQHTVREEPPALPRRAAETTRTEIR